jgi:hypothetical protein
VVLKSQYPVLVSRQDEKENYCGGGTIYNIAVTWLVILAKILIIPNVLDNMKPKWPMEEIFHFYFASPGMFSKVKVHAFDLKIEKYNQI